ncbi:type II toxin-antitoxin system VapC family toxin [Sulfuriferula thiophila]|uniref:type II toxin-antitoxin system VapC family toxin n=1 Tax=Sulfuriferula thiophila TaxID=1781211 RepID=UPI000F606B3E|nr:type II toxin-antitoxin system VapC family toxin [Sulfuriferula thiophila]
MMLRLNAVDVASVKDRPLLFDTNILLYLFGSANTNSNQSIIQTYSAMFGMCLKMGSRLCVDVLVLSEFINRFLRIQYDNHLTNARLDKKSLAFKQFRSSAEGMQAAHDIEAVVKDRILKQFQVVGKQFDTADIAAISFANTDFNDALLIQICQENSCVLVTHDADFNGANIDIVTANSRLR